MEPNTPEQTPNPKRKPSPAISPRDIEQGFGDKLKDIANVFEKLSKAEDDENMQFLHELLYGTKKAKNSWTENILEFSGVVGSGPDLHRKMKNVKEKLAKCPDSRLLYLCNVFDIPRVSEMSKLRIVEELAQFLEFPWPTDGYTPMETMEHDSERTNSEEKSSDPKTDAENQESVQNKDEVEEGDDEEEGDQSESAHENDKPKGEDELEDGGDEGGGDQGEFAHENDEPKDEEELEDGGDEGGGDQSESAHENNEPKDEEEEEEDSTEAEENPPDKKGSTSSK